MNKQDILDRIEVLKKDRKQHEAMCLLVDGALQDCDYWLEQLNKEAEPNESE